MEVDQTSESDFVTCVFSAGFWQRGPAEGSRRDSTAVVRGPGL